MKRIAFLVFLVVMLAGAWIVFKLAAKHSPADELRDKFYTALDSGEPTRLFALMDPTLQEQFDTPVLAAWQAGINTLMGKHNPKEGIEEVFADGEEYTGGKWVVTCSGEAIFETGTAHLAFTAVDDRMTELTFDAERLKDGEWITSLDISMYKTRGSQLLIALSESQYIVAREYVEPELAAKLTDEVLEATMGAINEHMGQVDAIVFHAPVWRVSEAERTLTLFYLWKGQVREGAAYVVFSFDDNRMGKIVDADLLKREHLMADMARAAGTE